MEECVAKFHRHFRRSEMPKHWKESHGCFSGRHAPANYRRSRVRLARIKENHHLRAALTNNKLDNYEPLNIAKRDADWLYF